MISQKAVAAWLAREFTSFEWMKRLDRPTLIREMKQFRVPPTFKTEDWLHQLVCHYIGMCEPRFLFLLDMGLGKSKIISDLVTQAQREKRLKRALVTVPRLVNIDSWMDALREHSDLEPNPVMVEDIEEKRYRLLHPTGDITVIDYMGLQWALCRKVKAGKGKMRLEPDPELVAKAQRLYNFIGIDESHKLRNAGTLWFDLVDQIATPADRVYALTGTLFGKSPEEMWAQFKLVDRGETFGENKGLFHGAFFTAKPHPFRREPIYTYNKAKTRQLNKMIAHRSMRYDEDEVSDLPPMVRHKIVMDMAVDQHEHYLRALEGVINHGGGDPRALDAPWLRMRQLTSGYLKWRDANGDHIIHFKHNPKLEMLMRLVDEASGSSKVIICYDYTDTGALICKRLKEEGFDHEWFYGGTKNKPASRRRFLDDPECRVFVMNSEAGGTGNDGLQKVAKYMIFYESPTPVITRKQTEKRIHRAGMAGQAFVYDLVMRKTVDSGILKALDEGRDLYADVMSGRKRGLTGD